MAKAANPTVVGGFVVGATALAVAGALTFGSLDLFRKEFTMVSYFQSSTTGLDVGAPVRFQGVRVGSVTSISAVWDERDETIQIPVELTLVSGAVQSEHGRSEQTWSDPAAAMERFVQRGMRAELAMDSFVTGKLYVALVNDPDSPVRRVGHPELFEMPTTESGLQKLRKSLEDLPLEDLMASATEAVQAVLALVQKPEIDRLLATLNRIADHADETLGPTLDHLQSLTSTADAELATVTEDLRRLLRTTEARVGPLTDETVETLERARTTLDEVDALLAQVGAEVDPVSDEVTGSLAEFRTALENVNAVVGEDTTVLYRVAALLEEMAGAARAIRELADYLDRHPEALLSGKD